AADLEVLHSLRRQNEAIRTEMDNIRIALEAKRALESAKRRESAHLTNAQQKRRELLAEISRDQKAQEDRNKRWAREYKQATALMDRLLEEQIARDRKIVPGAAIKGYNFAGRRGSLPW